MGPDRYLYIVVLVLMIFSAFFSASETAFSSVNLIRLRNAREEGRKGAKIALFIAEHFENTLSTILIGNNVVNIAASSIATIIAVAAVGSAYGTAAGSAYGPVVSTAVTTVIVLLFGEIFPKTYAKEHSFELCLKIGWILLIFYRIFAPIVFVVVRLNKLFSKIFKGNDAAKPSVTEDELEVILDTMEEEGVIQEDEGEMMRNVLDLRDTSVYDIMTPRVDMVGVYLDDDITYIKELFFKEKFSRIPVYRETKDNVVGILYERDFFSAMIEANDPNAVNIERIMRTPIFVTKTMHVDALITLLQRNKQHLAIVSDEYGGTSGLVTMEDCLEELVGEIYDEHDEEEFDIKKIDERTYEVSASIALDDLFEELELGDAPETHYNNLGGWLYQQLEEIPQVGDQYTHVSYLIVENDVTTMDDDEYIEQTLNFTVKELQERRMKTILLSIEKKEPQKKVKQEKEAKEVEKVEVEPSTDPESTLVDSVENQ